MGCGKIEKICEDGRLYLRNYGYLIRAKGEFENVKKDDTIQFEQDGAKIAKSIFAWRKKSG